MCYRKERRMKNVIHYILALFPIFGKYYFFDKCPYKQGDTCRVWNCYAYRSKSKIYHLCPLNKKEGSKNEQR